MIIFFNFSKMFALKVFSKTHENWCQFRQFYNPFPWPPLSLCSGSHSKVRIESLWTMVRRLPVAVYAVVFLGCKIIKRYDFAPIKSESSINVMLSTFCLQHGLYRQHGFFRRMLGERWQIWPIAVTNSFLNCHRPWVVNIIMSPTSL